MSGTNTPRTRPVPFHIPHCPGGQPTEGVTTSIVLLSAFISRHFSCFHPTLPRSPFPRRYSWPFTGIYLKKYTIYSQIQKTQPRKWYGIILLLFLLRILLLYCCSYRLSNLSHTRTTVTPSQHVVSRCTALVVGVSGPKASVVGLSRTVQRINANPIQ